MIFIDPDGNDEFYFNEEGVLIRHVVNDKPNRYFVERIISYESLEAHSGMDNFHSRISYIPSETKTVEINPTYTKMYGGLLNFTIGGDSRGSSTELIDDSSSSGSNLTMLAKGSPILPVLLEDTDPELAALLDRESTRYHIQVMSEAAVNAVFLVEGAFTGGRALLNLARGGSVTIRAGFYGSDVRNAKFVREIKKGEKISDLIDEAKGITYIEDVEAAVIQLQNGSRYLVTGGRHGINLPSNTAKIYGHTHPRVMGGVNTPSEGDRRALDLLDGGNGQSKTYIFHDGQRTTIYRGKDARSDSSVTNY